MAVTSPFTIIFSVEPSVGVKLTEMNRPVMKTLIVDDEPIARRVLREDLEAYPEVDIVGEAENVEAGPATDRRAQTGSGIP
jgi:hypothetical protein